MMRIGSSVSSIIYLEDRSGAETDDVCGMKYWWNRLEGGGGITPKEDALALRIGAEIHNDLLTISKMTEEQLYPANIQLAVDEILAALTDEDKRDRKHMEILYRRLGWFVAFALFIEPRIRERYNTLYSEDELILDRDPLWVPITPDRILEDKLTKQIEYREYKSALRADPKWQHSWLYAIQMHLGIKVVEEELNRKVAFGQVMGLLKGSESYSDHHLVHPFVWGYMSTKSGKWSSETMRTAEWIGMPVWEYEAGVVRYIQDVVGKEGSLRIFPMSPPVFLNERMLDNWIDRRRFRQKQIATVKDVCKTDLTARSTFFEMRTRNCRPPFGDPCAYVKCCWNASIGADPLGSGDYVRRIPHHDVETIGVE